MSLTGLLRLFAAPIVFIIFLSASGLILLLAGRTKRWTKRAGGSLVACGIVLLYLLSISPISNLLVYSMESGYAAFSEDALPDMDIVVVLGGGYLPSGSLQKYPEASGATYSRLCNGVRIFKRSGAKKLVLSGGSAYPGSGSEAAVMKDLALRLGVQPDSIITESKSRNTMEQARLVSKILASGGKKRIGIVTSAIHMRRAESAFKKSFPGDGIVPLPVNYLSGNPNLGLTVIGFVPSADNFSISSYAIHEFIGMIWYFLRGAV
jgi:uncharacterized SAM-binding protein YcdF (DUF218 family)